jgi:hypothetical protein
MTSAISSGCDARRIGVVSPNAVMNAAPQGRRPVDRFRCHRADASLYSAGQAASHRLERRFRRAVGRTTGEPDSAGHAAQSDDGAAAALDQPGSQRPDDKQRSPDVAGEHLVVRRQIDLRRRTEHRDPRVVDPDVDFAGRSCPVRKKIGCDP